MFGGIRKEGTGHVLLVTGGTAQTAVATVLAQAVPAKILVHVPNLQSVHSEDPVAAVHHPKKANDKPT